MTAREGRADRAARAAVLAALVAAAFVASPFAAADGIPSRAEVEEAFLRGDFARAAQAAQKRILAGDDEPALAVLLGRSELARGRPREAAAAFAAALGRGAEGAHAVQAKIGRARAFFALGETRTACGILWELAADPDTPARDFRPVFTPLLANCTEGRSPTGGGRPARRTAPPAPPGSASPTAPAERWVVQVGAFAERANALAMLERVRKEASDLAAKGVLVRVGGLDLVFIGPYNDRAAAEAARDALGARGIRGFVRREPAAE